MDGVFIGVTVGEGDSEGVAAGSVSVSRVGVGGGVGVGVDSAIGVGVGVAVAVGGCRRHWQRKKAAKQSVTVVMTIRAIFCPSSVTSLLKLAGLLRRVVSRPRMGFSSREVEWFSSVVCIGIWSLPRVEKRMGKVRSFGSDDLALPKPGCAIWSTSAKKSTRSSTG